MPRRLTLVAATLLAAHPLAAQQQDSTPAPRVRIEGVTLVGDFAADLSPEAAARRTQSRIALRDVVVGARSRVGERATALVELRARDGRDLDVPAAYLEAPVGFLGATLRAGRQPIAFGLDAGRERYMLEFPEYPRVVEEFFGRNGARGTGLSAAIARIPGLPLGVSGAITDRAGERVDTLSPPEPVDQGLAGLTAMGRVTWAWMSGPVGRGGFGFSSSTGKREQPIVCVYQGTIGPVPCPFGINAANTRLTVVGLDGHFSVARVDARAEVMRLIVGATDLPTFENSRFAPIYAGVSGTYDGGYALLRARLVRGFAVAGRGEWLQNPAVRGYGDGWAGGLLEWSAGSAASVYASWEHRFASDSARMLLATAERDARDRIVLRGVVRLDARARW